MSSSQLSITVLGINFAPEKSGIAPYTTALAQGLVSRGHEVRVLTSFPHYPMWRPHAGQPVTDQESHHGVALTRLRHYVPARPTALRRALFEATFGARLVGADWGNPDVVVAVSPALISTAVAAVRALGGRRRPALGIIVQDLYSRGIQETGVGGGRLGAVMSGLEARVARSADGVAVIHDRFKAHLTNELGVSESRIRVIRNWTHLQPIRDFDTEQFRSSFGWAPNDVVVLHTGAMGAKQGLENVVKAARLADSRSEQVRFVLVGDGSQRGLLETMAAGVRSIEFLDHLDNEQFGQALRAADVLLVNERPGVKEMAVPSKLTSYFSSGRPVLAATDPGSTTAEEVRLSGGGIRVEAGAPLQLLETAIELGRDRARARELGNNGRLYCTETLSETAAIQQYDEWVRELAANRRRVQDEEYV